MFRLIWLRCLLIILISFRLNFALVRLCLIVHEFYCLISLFYFHTPRLLDEVYLKFFCFKSKIDLQVYLFILRQTILVL